MGFLDSLKTLLSPSKQELVSAQAGPAAARSTQRATKKLAKKLERERARREREFPDWEEDRRAEWVTRVFETVAQQAQARVIRREDSVEVQAVDQGRQLRVCCGISRGTLSCDAKLTNQLGMLMLQQNPEVRRPKVIEGDAFAPSDNRVFLTDAIYFEENGMVQDRVFEALEPEVREAIVTFMMQYEICLLAVLPEELKILSLAPLHTLSHPEDVSRNFLKFAANLCALFETSPGVGWTPGVYFNEGERVEIGQHAPAGSSAVMANFTPTVTCDYCSSTVMLNMRSQCPNCGAPLSA